MENAVKEQIKDAKIILKACKCPITDETIKAFICGMRWEDGNIQQESQSTIQFLPNIGDISQMLSQMTTNEMPY